MRFRILFLSILTASCLIPLAANAQDQADPIKQLLYPAELILQHRAELNLDDEQQEIIRKELRLVQSDVFDLKWEMKEEADRLAALLQTAPIDEPEVLSQADKVMALEHQIKRAHLAMLVRLKNMLTEAQIEMLKNYRKDWSPRKR